MTDRDPQEETLHFALQVLGAELVNEPPEGSYVDHVVKLQAAHKRGDITQDEFDDAVRRRLHAIHYANG